MSPTLPEDGVTPRVASNSYSGSPDLPALVPVDRAAYELSMSEGWVRKHISAGRIPVRYFGRQVRIPRESVLKLIENGLDEKEAG